VICPFMLRYLSMNGFAWFCMCVKQFNGRKQDCLPD